MARSRRAGGELQLNIPPPVGGINIATAVDKIQETEAEHLRGFEFDEYGVIGAPRAPKNLGTIVGGVVEVLSAHIFQRDTGLTQLIVHMSDGSLQYSTDFQTTTGSATWTSIATGVSTTQPFTFMTFLNAVWMTNGVDDYRKWDGATQTLYASAPKGKYLALWRDTLWVSGVTANPHRIHQSAPGDPATWPAFNFLDVEKGVGVGISGLYAVESALVAFKPMRTHIVFDPVEYTNRVIDNSKGCIANSSIVAHNGVIFFASHLGICRFLGDGPSQIVSEKVSPIFNDLYVFGTSLATQVLDTAYETSIWGYSFENFVGWHIPNNALSQYIKYFADMPDQPWIFGAPMDPPTLLGRAVIVSLRESGKYAQLYRLAGAPAILYREYGGTLADVVPCEWRTGWFSFDQPFFEKYVSLIEILHRGDINVILNRDFRNEEQGGEDSETVAVSLSAPLNKLSKSRIYCDTYCRDLQVVIQSTVAEETKVLMASGLASPASVSRFQAAIGGIMVKAKALSEMRV